MFFAVITGKQEIITTELISLFLVFLSVFLESLKNLIELPHTYVFNTRLIDCMVLKAFSTFTSIISRWPATCSRGAFRVVMCLSSVVRRASRVVNNIFKHLLLPNRWANLDQTWQECFLGGPLQKLIAEFDPSKTLVAMATKVGEDDSSSAFTNDSWDHHSQIFLFFFSNSDVTSDWLNQIM